MGIQRQYFHQYVRFLFFFNLKITGTMGTNDWDNCFSMCKAFDFFAQVLSKVY